MNSQPNSTKKTTKINVKIGLDIATKRTGLAIYINDKLEQYGTLETNPEMLYSGEKVVKDAVEINRFWLGFSAKLKDKLKDKYGEDEEFYLNILAGLESSNHANKSLGQKLATYIGLYTSAIVNTFAVAFPLNDIEFKLLNPREWQLRVFGEVLDRKDGKLKSIRKALEVIKRDVEPEVLEKVPKMLEITDDAADAINIANILDVLRDNLLVGQERRERVNKKIKNKNNILNVQIKINKLLDNLRDKKQKALEKELTKKKPNIEIIKNQPLISFADKSQRERILKYQNELERLEADTSIINKFKIIGEENNNA